MPVELQNCIFLHVPKTGGVWVERALLKYSNVKGSNKSIHEGHLMPDIPYNKGCFAFVRHPITWLKSLYHQRKRKNWNWQEYLELENKCKSDNFTDFLNKVCNYPGILNRYFEYYIKKYETKQNFIVGKTEYLCADLIKILRYYKEDFHMWELIKYNNMKQNIMRDIEIEKITENFYEKIFKSQQDYYEKYKYSIMPITVNKNYLFEYGLQQKLRDLKNGSW